jgi:hypothetical protein
VNVYYSYSPAASRPTILEYTGVPEGAGQRLGSRHSELAADYREALRHAPLTLTKVKFKAFKTYLAVNAVENWHATRPIPETYGRKPPAFDPARVGLKQIDETVAASPRLRFVFAGHVLWLALCLVGTGFIGWKVVWSKGSNPRWRIGLLLALIPMTYYASHLLAVAGHWYRYMYPATLLVQMEAVVLCGILILRASGVIRRTATTTWSRAAFRQIYKRVRTSTAATGNRRPSSNSTSNFRASTS